jgi:hypothetical protein
VYFALLYGVVTWIANHHREWGKGRWCYAALSVMLLDRRNACACIDLLSLVSLYQSNLDISQICLFKIRQPSGVFLLVLMNH